jgi:ribosomal protein S17
LNLKAKVIRIEESVADRVLIAMLRPTVTDKSFFVIDYFLLIINIRKI